VRAVLDTNIYVSALALPGSIAEEALQQAAFKRYDLVTSPAILAELANVLTRKFEWDPTRALEACREIADLSIVVRPTQRIEILRDKPDNRLLECAVAAHAERLVTGDKHLLRLSRYEGTRIVRLADFLKDLA
jgi:putative PIN family toxin of toxin-antitoxin system